MPHDIELCDLWETRDLVTQQMRRDGRLHRELRHLRLREGIAYSSRHRLLEDQVLAIDHSLNPLDRIFLPVLHGYPSARTYDARSAVESAADRRSISSRRFISVTHMRSWWERSG